MPSRSLVSRRSFMRIAGATATAVPLLAGSRSALALTGEPTRFADYDALRARFLDPNAVIISSNENPLGPSMGALAAIASASRQGGRYHHESKGEVIEVFSRLFNLKEGYVTFWPGSSSPLDLALKSNIGPEKSLVVADPSYEQGPRAGEAMKAKVHSIPLTAKGAHDVRRMVAADASAGAYYIVNPNNPTGTMTSREDILWLLKNKAPGSVVIVDEAYHHFSHDVPLIDQVAADQDIIVTRTFSKIYGMAGLRGGLFIARPDIQARLARLGPAATRDGASEVSMATAHACTASLKDKQLVPKRRAINSAVREATLEWMEKRGYHYYPGSQANFFMVDVKRPGREFAALMQKEDVYIGRTWAAMPTYVRVTVGTAAEMKKFQTAFAKVYETAPSTAHLDLPYTAPSELPRQYA
ncbi:MAG TPA: aminotransferase class I/II-fold pyridoxal phosphate-dependent enzyme [Steroidobacteraceae bacterium]|nr:aminotransferase class I/II-fold pyridoxal phosphate-dependent enzyme [Steroidobacteraceae bacterium]